MLAGLIQLGAYLVLVGGIAYVTLGIVFHTKGLTRSKWGTYSAAAGIPVALGGLVWVASQLHDLNVPASRGSIPNVEAYAGPLPFYLGLCGGLFLGILGLSLGLIGFTRSGDEEPAEETRERRQPADSDPEKEKRRRLARARRRRKSRTEELDTESEPATHP